MLVQPNETLDWNGKTYDLRISTEPSGHKIKTYRGERCLATYTVAYETDTDILAQHGVRGLEMLRDLAVDDIKQGVLKEQSS